MMDFQPGFPLLSLFGQKDGEVHCKGGKMVQTEFFVEILINRFTSSLRIPHHSSCLVVFDRFNDYCDSNDSRTIGNL